MAGFKPFKPQAPQGPPFKARGAQARAGALLGALLSSPALGVRLMTALPKCSKYKPLTALAGKEFLEFKPLCVHTDTARGGAWTGT